MNFETIEKPMKTKLLIGFGDLSSFGRLTAHTDDADLFSMLDQWYEVVGTVVENAGGKVVKFVDDAVLIIFPEDKADEGVQAFLELGKKTKTFFAEKEISTKLKTTVHFGEVVLGMVGAKGEKRLDVLGKNVNIAAMLETKNSFAMSAAAFRSLSAGSRKLFKKHTPPITYIPVEEGHRD